MEISDNAFDKKVNNYYENDFWDWFVKNEASFKQLGKVTPAEEEQLLEIIIVELSKFNPWLQVLSGQCNEDNTELIITVDGDVALFTVVEGLINKAPLVPGWRFTAHKPAMDIANLSISMYDIDFNEETVHFYPILEDKYPDDILLVITHKYFDASKMPDFRSGMIDFVENGIGELNIATQIDELTFGPEPDDKSKLIPISKLNGYLTWRKKEAENSYHFSDIYYPENRFDSIEGEDHEGNVIIASVNLGFADWPYKFMYGWMVSVSIDYPQSEKGLPTPAVMKVLEEEEAKIIEQLTNQSETLYTACKTYKGDRTLYFFSKKYDQPSKILNILTDSDDITSSLMFFVEKDRYWRSVDEFWKEDESEEEEEEEL